MRGSRLLIIVVLVKCRRAVGESSSFLIRRGMSVVGPYVDKFVAADCVEGTTQAKADVTCDYRTIICE